MNKIARCYLAIIVIIGTTLLTDCKKEDVPVITTTAVSNFTATTATSGGNITDEGSSTVIARGVCWSTGTTPTIADNKTTDGSGAGSFSSNIIDLFGGTTYFVRAYATNSTGTGYGMAMSFKTTGQPPSAPSATTQNATSIQISSATLNATVNAMYYSTVVTFEYGTTTSYGSTIAATQSPLTGGTNTNVSASITGLSEGITYHYRIKAVNSLGTTTGNDLTFKTLGNVPTCTTLAATNKTTEGAQLNATVNANNLSTTVSFEYGKTISYGSAAIATQSPVTGSSNTNVSASITGLTAGTIYHFRVKTANSLGTNYGNDLTFTTLGQVPTVATLAATNITTVGAQLNATVNANYLSTVVIFEYGTTTSYGSTITANQSPVTGGTNTNVNASISALTVGSTHHYRVKAVNSLGTSYGSDMTFTTLGAVPTASTTAITIITTTGATVNGIVNANYFSTTVSFEYGLTTGYGSTATATPSTVTGNTSTNVSTSITGLTVGTNYHYRVVSTNSLGTTNGNDRTFTTAPTTVNDVDGNTYNVVAIGAQVWMKENLNTTKYNDGTAIPNITDNTAWAALTTGAYSDYDNTPSNSTTYGRLYNWYSVDNNATTRVASNGSKNVCPTGWHVSTDAEWTTLITYLGGESVAGGKLKETSTTHWTTPNTGATNETGFTALPGGYHINSGACSDIWGSGYWWSSTGYSATVAWYRDVRYSQADVDRSGSYKQLGFSVRCLRD